MKRSKFTEEQVVRLLEEAASGACTNAEVCRKHGISQNTLYLWKRRYGGMESRDVRRLRELEASSPNHVWTVDFIHDACLNGTRLKILSVVDEFTRECLALEVATRINAERVRQVLLPLMRERGAPSFVRSDNGGEFIARLLAVFLSASGTRSRFIESGKPWQNGYVESFHSTLRRDHLDVEVFVNLADARAKTAVYRRHYNEVRPHSSLGNRPPAVAALARESVNSGRATPSLHCPIPVPEYKKGLIL